ncbi:MAG TPA: sialate O-acetylesterase, partial [Chitinophagaceae bacterium]|nr:sialate O-acetylesterase [Chitinophagaceae bacterium]
MKKLFIFTCFVFGALLSAKAAVHLPRIFGDNMVLQRNKQIPVWGWADAGEEVTVLFNKQEEKKVKASATGKWMIMLDPEKEGGPYTLTVKGGNTITLNNVLVGEVWVCSGQSNMEFMVRGAINADKEIATANYPQIRHFKVPLTVSGMPKEDIGGGEWKVCSPQTVADFTAVGYFFARELYNKLHVPIGLINTTWGGTESETWTSRQAFEQDDEFKSMIAGMPVLNLDSLAKMKKDAAIQKINTLQGGLPAAKEAIQWKEAAFNTAGWPTMQLPGLWESTKLGDLDGVVWFRKEVYIPASDTGKEAVLELSMIDDNDITYINGVRVGSTNAYNAKRKYVIPAGVLKAGRNVIAVRVEDTGGGGGIY